MGDAFGTYQLHEKIAQGGMAEVFLASKQGEIGGFSRRLAIKRMFPHFVDRDDIINMFIDEARIASRLHHSNIIQIYDLGVVDGTFFIAMEYVEGLDLRRVCELGVEFNQFISRPMAVYIAAEVAAGLEYAHGQTDQQGRPMNIIHRDVSPQNVLLSVDGAVKICDFGIAKAESRLTETRVGEFKGKFSYMSPEQFGRGELDHRSDIFTLGIVLYETTAATRLFRSDSEYEAMRKITSGEITPPSAVHRDYPPRLQEIVLKALALEPENRYATAAEFRADLEDWLFEQRTRVGRRQVGEYVERLREESEQRESGAGRGERPGASEEHRRRETAPPEAPEPPVEPTTQMTLTDEELERIDGGMSSVGDGDSTIELTVSEEGIEAAADGTGCVGQSVDEDIEPTLDETVSADTLDERPGVSDAGGPDSESAPKQRTSSSASAAVEIKRISAEEARRRRGDDQSQRDETVDSDDMPTIVDDRLDEETTAPMRGDDFEVGPTQVVDGDRQTSDSGEVTAIHLADDDLGEVDDKQALPPSGPSAPGDGRRAQRENGRRSAIGDTGNIDVADHTMSGDGDELLDDMPDLRPGGRELTGLNEIQGHSRRERRTDRMEAVESTDDAGNDDGMRIEIVVGVAAAVVIVGLLVWFGW